jgi:hypothetical protein
MVIQQWSKQTFHPHNPEGVSDTPPWFFFFYKFIGKMLNFSVKKKQSRSSRAREQLPQVLEESLP